MPILESLTIDQDTLLQTHKQDYIDFIINNEKYRVKDLHLKDICDDINWIYEKAGLRNKKPKFILIAQSYEEEKLMINFVFNIIGHKNLPNCKTSKRISKHVVDNIHKQVRNQVKEKVCTPYYNPLRDQNLDEFTEVLSEEVYDLIYDQLHNQVSNQIRNEVSYKICKQVYDQLGNQIPIQVRNRVSHRTCNQIFDQTGYKITEQESSQVWNRIKEKKLTWVAHGLGLSSNNDWLSSYSFLEKIGFVQNNDFSRYHAFLKKGIWSFQCFDDWCIVTNLPKKINRDHENKLHSIDGSSIEWSNGDKNYFIHGVSFEPEIWEQVVADNADPFEIFKIQNQEQRRSALSVVPLQTILKRTKACLISSFTRSTPPRLSKEYVIDHHNLNFKNEIKLFEVHGGHFNFEENMKIVNYFCPSTGREYFDFVPPPINRASEAMAWKFNVDEEDYINNFVVET